jgi:hypothetical protein
MPSQGVVYQVVRDHFETFRAQAAGLRDGEGLPRFVEQEFRELLRCGSLAGGFARFRCDDCGQDRLVPFSCKGRGLRELRPFDLAQGRPEQRRGTPVAGWRNAPRTWWTTCSRRCLCDSGF